MVQHTSQRTRPTEGAEVSRQRDRSDRLEELVRLMALEAIATEADIDRIVRDLDLQRWQDLPSLRWRVDECRRAELGYD